MNNVNFYVTSALLVASELGILSDINNLLISSVTLQELENLIQRIEHEGGIAYKQDIFNGDYNSLSNTPDLSIYAKKTDIPTNFITLNQLDTRSEEIKNNLIGTDNDTETSNTIKGAIKAAQNFSNKALSDAKEYINKQTASDKLPKATTEQFGVVKVGQGLKISATGTLIATGEGVVADAVEWNNVINKPQPDEIENDQYYLTLINTLGTVARSNNYNDLNNKPDLSIYAEKSAIPDLYELPVATTETLGGVKIDGKTITIKDGVIKAQDAGAKITWRKWTE